MERRNFEGDWENCVADQSGLLIDPCGCERFMGLQRTLASRGEPSVLVLIISNLYCLELTLTSFFS